MSDERVAGDASTGRICPWCSAPLPAEPLDRCPSCNAALQGEGEGAQLPGLTTIDPVAILEGTRQPTKTRSSRLMAWITGSDIEEAAEPVASPDALAPPPPEVRLEMLRMETEAELARKSAEVESMVTDEAIQAQEAGDEAAARQAVQAVLGADARTDAMVESPEEEQAELAEASPVATGPEAAVAGGEASTTPAAEEASGS